MGNHCRGWKSEMNPVSFFFFLRFFFFFNVDHVLKVFIEFLTVLLLFYALVFGP